MRGGAGLPPRAGRIGAAGFREDRSRARRRVQFLGLGMAVFLCGLTQVWLALQVGERSSQVWTLETTRQRMEVDLSVQQVRLAKLRTFGALLPAAGSLGLDQDAYHEYLTLEAPVSEEAGKLDELATELLRGTRLILPDALAQERPKEGARRDAQP